MHRLACLLILAFALAGSGMAQAPEPEPQMHPSIPDARKLAADYQLQSALGDRKCDIALDAKASGPGHALVFDHTVCLPLFRFLSDTVAWLPGVAGSILFVNASKRVVSEFTEGVGGQYEALLEGDGVYFLTNTQFVEPGDVTRFSDAVGEWNLSRPDGPAICSLTLTDESAGDDLFKVMLRAGCDPAIVRFGPAKWYLDRGDIVLLSAKDDRMRFGRQPEGNWAKIPEMPRPLVLSRP